METITLKAVVKAAQEYMSVHYTQLINNKIDVSSENKKNEILIILKTYLTENKYDVVKHRNKGNSTNSNEYYSFEELSLIIYNEIANYSILSEYLYDKNVEEINVTSWNDIKVIYSGGKATTLDIAFLDRESAIDTIKHLFMNNSPIQLDENTPYARASVVIEDVQTRITAALDTIGDPKDGIICSIRRINPKSLTAADFISKGTINDIIANFSKGLALCHISASVAGETGSGKTTFLQAAILWYVNPQDLILCIEEDVREFNLRREINGVVNNIEYLKTRKSGNSDREITQKELIELAVTLHPQYLAPGEMKGAEAMSALTAALSGHTTYTTIHVDECSKFPSRFLALIQQSSPGLSETTVYRMMCEAFPIVMHFSQFPDGVRRCTQIVEFYNDSDSFTNVNIQMNSLFRFVRTGDIYDEEGKIIKIDGYYKRENDISDRMLKSLTSKGIEAKYIKLLLSEERYERYIKETFNKTEVN